MEVKTQSDKLMEMRIRDNYITWGYYDEMERMEKIGKGDFENEKRN